jgi:hypothetical protein
MFGTGSIRAEFFSKAFSEPLSQILQCNIVPERAPRNRGALLHINFRESWGWEGGLNPYEKLSRRILSQLLTFCKTLQPVAYRRISHIHALYTNPGSGYERVVSIDPGLGQHG